MSDSEKESERTRDKVVKVGKFLQKNITKGEIALKHAAGLGHVPNAIPLADPRADGPPRSVEVGWHPVGGFAGKWFAEQTGLGKLITDRINKYPDPTQHWAVLIGEYAHQLWMDEDFHVIYTNQKVTREEWHTFRVGETRFNDEATRQAGESVISGIREKQPAYNLITNNCQTYVLKLLDAIKVGMHKEFGTTLAVYKKLTGSGKVAELFDQPGRPGVTTDVAVVTDVSQGAQEEVVFAPPNRQNTLLLAQDVMNQETNQLDAEEEMKKHKLDRKSIFSRFSRHK